MNLCPVMHETWLAYLLQFWLAGHTLKSKSSSQCHRRSFLSKWFYKEPLTSKEHKECLIIFRLLKGKEEMVLLLWVLQYDITQCISR